MQSFFLKQVITYITTSEVLAPFKKKTGSALNNF